MDKHVRLMESAVAAGKPAIEPLLAAIESRFCRDLESPEYHEDDACVLVNNMIKQILGIRGYEHTACGMCPQGRFIKQSGRYERTSRREPT